MLPGSNRLVFTGISPTWGGFYVSTMGAASLVFDDLGLNYVVLIGLPGAHELFTDLRRCSARRTNVLGACDLGRLTETTVDSLRDPLVVHVADGGAGREARCRIRFAALR